jgi:bifunctional DNA-binding transcriptional regulator/antitoxin component of YhaV-PrlF toxin-antitoxin module
MAKGKVQFKALQSKAKIEGKEAGVVAAITPPVDVPEMFGTRARVPIRGTINGSPFRSSLMPCGGRHMMPVNKVLRERAGVRPGDTVEVVMERDEAERTVDAPSQVKKELAKSQRARDKWETLSFTHKKEMAISIRDAKQEETRAQRLAKIMQVLTTSEKWTG